MVADHLRIHMGGIEPKCRPRSTRKRRLSRKVPVQMTRVCAALRVLHERADRANKLRQQHRIGGGAGDTRDDVAINLGILSRSRSRPCGSSRLVAPQSSR